MSSSGGEVSTGSGSDRVIVLAISAIAWIETRSLPLPVLTRHRHRQCRSAVNISET